MNIDLLRNEIVQGQVATLTAQIFVWKKYGKETNEDTTSIQTELQTQIEKSELLVVNVSGIAA